MLEISLITVIYNWISRLWYVTQLELNIKKSCWGKRKDKKGSWEKMFKYCLHKRFFLHLLYEYGICSLKMNKNMNKRATENYIFKFLTVSSVSNDSIVKESLMTLSIRLWKLPKSTSKKQYIYNILLINMTHVSN